MDKLDIEACKKENPFIVLADVIYKHLKNDIMQGLLLPGDKIVESKIAQQLDVSRTPVNIALNRALKDGWLERRSKRFLTVRKISPQECFYLYEARKLNKDFQRIRPVGVQNPSFPDCCNNHRPPPRAGNSLPPAASR